MTKRSASQSGFTLIELMITVAIVGILAAVAIPSYQDYIARSQLSEGLSLISGGKPVVSEYYSNHGEWPTLAQSGFTGSTGKYITQTTIGNNGQIIATLGGEANNKINGQTVTLTPKLEEAGNVSWNCTSTADAKYLPNSCSHVAGTENNSGNDGTGGTGGDNGSTTPVDPLTQVPGYQYYTNAYQVPRDGSPISRYIPVPTGGTFDQSGATIYMDENGNLITNNSVMYNKNGQTVFENIIHTLSPTNIAPDGTITYTDENGASSIMRPDGTLIRNFTGNIAAKDASGNPIEGTMTAVSYTDSSVLKDISYSYNGTDYHVIAMNAMNTTGLPSDLTNLISKVNSTSSTLVGGVWSNANPSTSNLASYHTAAANLKAALVSAQSANGGTLPASYPAYLTDLITML